MDPRRAAMLGLLSALLFGAAAPVAKLLLARSGPLVLAGLFYIGALGTMLLARRTRREAPLTRADLPWLLGSVIAGAVLAPPLLLLGLTRASALTGSLLLNLEAPLTMALAVLFFGEHLSPREAAAAALVVLGGALLGMPGKDSGGSLFGAACIAAACLCWAIDNNCNARLALKDPVQVLRIKAFAAGAVNLALGLLLREPVDRRIALPLLVGAISYGASFWLYLLAQRALGAARQAALFAVAPFAGAALAVPLLGDRPAPLDLAAAALMAAGVVWLLRERHSHQHTHAELSHEHLHIHDQHHQHAHEGPPTEPHSHPHRHGGLTHEHPHVSDAHHKHRH
jgi:drug/metabolite transporter (DMT)-like permease